MKSRKNEKSIARCAIGSMGIVAGVAAVVLCACSGYPKSENDWGNAEEEYEDEIKLYIEERYGLADNPVYGIRVSNTVRKDGSRKTTYDEEFIEGSNGGAVFYKVVHPSENEDGLVCIYLADDENGSIFLNAEYVYDYRVAGSGGYTVSLCNPEIKSRCYAVINDNWLVWAEMSEEEDLTASAGKDITQYKEEVYGYRLTGSSMEESYRITREIRQGDTGELRAYTIRNQSELVVYASGYTSYTAEGAQYVSTQQEFCDRANELLKESGVENIALDKTSWNNRWFGIETDESQLGKEIVKVDFAYSNIMTNENNDEIIDIEIETNRKKTEAEERGRQEEINDSPVVYG